MKTLFAITAFLLAVAPARAANENRVCHGETKAGVPFTLVVTDTTHTQKYDAAIKLQIKGRAALAYKAVFTEAEADVSAGFASIENGGLRVEVYDAPEAGQSWLRARAVGGAVDLLCDEAQ